MSVLDNCRFGSSLSMRSFGRLGSSVSVMDFAHLGSSMSLRGVHKLYGKTLSIYGKDKSRLHFATYANYIASENDAPADPYGSKLRIEHYFANTRALAVNSGGGVLHGTWIADFPLSISDRSLKTNIRNLEDVLEADRPSNVLQEMRPVSYQYKTGEDGKNVRFGFIADEMQKALPEITRKLPEQEDKQGIVYQDLLAFLVSQLQKLSREMAVLMPRLVSIESRIVQRKKWKRAKRRKLKAAQAAAGLAVGTQQASLPVSV